MPAPPHLPRPFSHDARTALLDRVAARIAEQRYDAPAEGPGAGEGAWSRRAAAREWVRKRWLFTPVAEDAEEAGFEVLGCARNVDDGAPRVHAEAALMALAYACASGWKSGSSMFDGAEGLGEAEAKEVLERVLLVRVSSLQYNEGC